MQPGQISRALVCAVCLVAAAPRLSFGVISYYTTRGSFVAANPGLPTETFEAGAIGPGAYTLFTGPLNSSTSNPWFDPGDIRGGISLSDDPGPGEGELVLVGAGTLPGISKGILALQYADGLAVDFAPAVRSIGTDLASSAGPGVIGTEPIVVRVYGPGGLLDTRTVTGVGIRFLGISSSTDTIARIEIADQSAGTSEFIDNLTFGTVPEPAAGIVMFSVAFILARRERT